MTEADANAVLEPGETLRHFAPGRATIENPWAGPWTALKLILSIALASVGVFIGFSFPWIGFLIVALGLLAVYFLFFQGGNAKTSYAVTDRRVLILPPKGSLKTIAEVTEVSTDTSGAVRVRDGDGKLHCLTPADADALERAILELASPARDAVVPSPDNLGMESLLLDGEQVLWRGKIKAQYVLGTQLRWLLWLVIFGMFLADILSNGLTFSRAVALLCCLPQILILTNEGHYVITNRRAW